MLRVTLSLVMVVTATVITAAERSLDSLKQTYETEVQKIENVHEVQLSKLLDTYGRSLDKAVGMLKKNGDPDAVLQALAEKKRFENDRAVPTEADSKLPRLLQDVQASYLKAVGKIDAEKAQAMADLTPNYIAALERLMKALTAQEKLDLALNVKAEKERVEFILADIKTRLRKQAAARPRSRITEPKPKSELMAKGKLPASLSKGLVLYYGFDKDEGGKVTDTSM